MFWVEELEYHIVVPGDPEEKGRCCLIAVKEGANMSADGFVVVLMGLCTGSLTKNPVRWVANLEPEITLTRIASRVIRSV